MQTRIQISEGKKRKTIFPVQLKAIKQRSSKGKLLRASNVNQHNPKIIYPTNRRARIECGWSQHRSRDEENQTGRCSKTIHA